MNNYQLFQAQKNAVTRGIAIFFSIGFFLQITAQDLQNFDKKKPIKVNGSIGMQGVFYNMQGAPQRRQPFSYMLNGNINFTLFGIIDMPVGFTLSEQERNFSQPFNQIGFSPSYKGVTVHLGYRSLTWGQFSLAGYNFLLGGVEVQKKWFRVGAVYGRLNRETRPDTVGETASLQPAFKRMGYAAKLGFGTVNNYLDIVYFTAADKGDSLPTSQFYNAVRPAENAVISLITSHKFLKHFFLKGEYAMSSTNLDTKVGGAPLHGEGLGLIKLNSTGGAGTALTATLGYQKKSVRIEMNARQQTLDFRSFGGYQFNSNFAQYGTNISYSVAKNKLRITHLLNYMDDNLNKKKNVTTLRIMPSTNLDWQASSKFGLGLNYNLVRSQQKLANAGSQAQNLERQLLNQFNHVVTLMPRIIFKGEKKQSVIMMMQTFQTTKDNNENTKVFTENNTSFSNLNYNLNFIKTGFGIGAGIFHSIVKNKANNISTSGVNCGLNKTFAKGLVQTQLQNAFSFNKFGNTINSNLNVNFRAKKFHVVGFNAGLVVNSPTGGTGSFTEFQGRLLYMLNF